MSLVGKLVGFGLRQAIRAVAGDEAGEATAIAADNVIQLVEQHFTDHSQVLPAALARANDRAWQAVSIALAGDSFLDKITVFFASGDDKGIREQIRLFLQDKTIDYGGTPAEIRKKCLTELTHARQKGLLTARNLSTHDIACHAAGFQRYLDPKSMVDGAERVIGKIADDLALDCPNLAKLLRQHPSVKPSLLVSAFAYFFRREVETNDELAHGFFFDGLRQLSASQESAFREVNKALTTLGDQFEQVFAQLHRIETVTLETHGAVLDMQAELQRLGSLNLTNIDEVRRLMQEVLVRVSQAGMHKGEVQPQHSFSIRSEDERIAVKQLLARFRQLPAQQQKQVPALLNGLGKLQFGSADFDGARKTFLAVSQNITDTAAQAEAQFNAYHAALEEKKWDEALAAIRLAASLDSQRFAPFPMERYEAKRILGAGGFGTAFLCHDHQLNSEVVVKTLHDAALEKDAFREAHVLKDLSHPTIIRVRAVAYCDKEQKARPYIVMDYFPGESLERHIQNDGILKIEDLLVIARQIAQGMRFAHQKNILHRDLKPDNVLVHKEGNSWKVSIIDFGLALRRRTIEKTRAAHLAGKTMLGGSVAGTLKYAPPEQMGELGGVKPGPYSDVYSFGKLCCFALFKTTEPIERHWSTVPESIRLDLREMLDKCRDGELQHRFPSFEPVLKVLDTLDPFEAERKKQEEARLKAELEQKRREQEETEKEQLHREEARQKAASERKRREEEEAEEKRVAVVRRQEQEDVRQRQRVNLVARQNGRTSTPGDWLGVVRTGVRLVGVGLILFLVLFVCVVGFHNSGGPAPQPTQQQKHLDEANGKARSVKSETEAVLRFQNHSAQTIKIYWLNFAGKRVLFNTLRRGQSYEQKTFLTHPWLITDEQDNALELHFPAAQPRTIVRQ